ncbi:MAG TPA: hypothetical protein VHE34_08575 [Puia sp.]|uniref:hypothetical protein n=1 Tax=Puia sp. TaxID=2045100 RepID=UPI002CBC4F1F|nr:hypothetical protein [Puia sp.]HVU95264.1 hypothetical protein [Puia sp.]
MKLPKKIELINCDPADIGEAIEAVQASLEIEYELIALQDAKTFGEYCDVVMAALGRQHRDGCTAQQGFYKLRMAIGKVLKKDMAGITPATRMDSLFPAAGRQRKVRELQQELGVGMGLLDLRRGVGWGVFGCYLLAFLGIFINWRYGLAGLGVCLILNRVAWRFANQFTNGTVGEVARRFALHYYRRARRDPETVNRHEVVPVIKGIFQRVLHVDAETLTRDAVLG